MIDLKITKREITDSTDDYSPIDENQIAADIQFVSGKGELDDPYRVKIELKNLMAEKWQGIIHVQMPFEKKNPKFFMPGFMYGRNRGEAPLDVLNEFPRLRPGAFKRPASSWWMTRSDRLSHPTVLTFDDGSIYGLTAGPYLVEREGLQSQWQPSSTGSNFSQYCGFSCSLEKGTIGYTLGYENAPWFFLRSDTVKERARLGENCLTLAPEETLSVEMDVICSQKNHQLTDLNKVIASVYTNYHQSPRKGSPLKTAVKDLAKAVYTDAYLPEDKGYAGQVFEDSDESYRLNKIMSLSWTNGLSVSVPMLMAANRLDHEDMRDQALEAITYIVDHSLNPATGLPFDAVNDHVWSTKGWWFDGMHNPGHSGYLMGQAMYYLMKGYIFEKETREIYHPEWLRFVEGILEKAKQTLNNDGEYPFILSEQTGAGLEYDSLGSAWLLTAQVLYACLENDTSDLDQMIKSEQHYFDTFIKQMECYGGPLDSDKATDSEGVLAYIRAVRYLHQLTGNDLYLSHLRDALDYEFSFKFCYNSPVKIDPLKKVNWSSCGGSITSIANPHVHPMSSTIVDELLYYIDQTGDEYVNSRLNDVVDWGCQTYNQVDREYDFGKKGWMSERFCHSEGLLTQLYPNGEVASTWFCLMPWACTSIIEGLSGDFWSRYEKIE